MTKPITKFDDIVEIYFESGSARIRFKKAYKRENLIGDKRDKSKDSMWNYSCLLYTSDAADE